MSPFDKEHRKISLYLFFCWRKHQAWRPLFLHPSSSWGAAPWLSHFHMKSLMTTLTTYRTSRWGAWRASGPSRSRISWPISWRVSISLNIYFPYRIGYLLIRRPSTTLSSSASTTWSWRPSDLDSPTARQTINNWRGKLQNTDRSPWFQDLLLM